MRKAIYVSGKPPQREDRLSPCVGASPPACADHRVAPMWCSPLWLPCPHARWTCWNSANPITLLFKMHPSFPFCLQNTGLLSCWPPGPPTIAMIFPSSPLYLHFLCPISDLWLLARISMHSHLLYVASTVLPTWTAFVSIHLSRTFKMRSVATFPIIPSLTLLTWKDSLVIVNSPKVL